MKKTIAIFLALLFLGSTAGAVETAPGAQERYTCSPWAQELVRQAAALNLARWPYRGDASEPITRGDFGENAAALAALAYGADLDTYLNAQNFLAQKENKEVTPVSTRLGILLGRENGDWDLNGLITRQEAAVMLARAYRVYADEIHDDMEPLSYGDKDEIADWARTDVQLMTHLGIMNGVGNQRFDPEGTYTAEQCFATLVRLYEKTCQGAEPAGRDPFVLTPLEAAIGQAWKSSYHLAAYGESEHLIAYAWALGGGSMSGGQYYVTVLDGNVTRQDYRDLIAGSSDARYGVKDAHIHTVSISPDESKVFYQADVREDVYDFDATGKQGVKLYDKGRYTVTIDLKTGAQTWARTDLIEDACDSSGGI